MRFAGGRKAGRVGFELGSGEVRNSDAAMEHQRIKAFLMMLAVPTSTSPLIEAISAARCPGVRLFG